MFINYLYTYVYEFNGENFIFAVHLVSLGPHHRAATQRRWAGACAIIIHNERHDWISSFSSHYRIPWRRRRTPPSRAWMEIHTLLAPPLTFCVSFECFWIKPIYVPRLFARSTNWRHILLQITPTEQATTGLTRRLTSPWLTPLSCLVADLADSILRLLWSRPPTPSAGRPTRSSRLTCLPPEIKLWLYENKWVFLYHWGYKYFCLLWTNIIIIFRSIF